MDAHSRLSLGTDPARHVISLFKHKDVQRGIFINKLIRTKYPAGTCADDYDIILHTIFLSVSLFRLYHTKYIIQSTGAWQDFYRGRHFARCQQNNSSMSVFPNIRRRSKELRTGKSFTDKKHCCEATFMLFVRVQTI